MRHPRTTLAVIAVAAAAGTTAVVAATAGGSTTTRPVPTVSGAAAAPVSPTVSPSGATIRTVNATVGGKTETVLVNAKGLPLYTYQRDTATKSFVSGTLASFWPPLVSANPTIAGAPGRVSVTNDANGAQVAYNGHFLYTFVTDSPGQVTGQGVQNFFVATPGLARIGASSPAPTTAPPARPSAGYGY